MPIASEFEPVPEATEPLSHTFLDAVWAHFVREPARIAMINAKDETDRVTYGELYAYSQSVSAFLEGRRFTRGSTACTVLPNSWQFVVSLIGTAQRGGTLSPASHMFTQYELEQQFRDSRCQLVFCSDSNLGRVMHAAQAVPAIKTIVVMAEERHAPKSLPSAVGDVRLVHFEDMLAHSQPHAQQLVHEHANVDVHRDVFILPYSSGTTGSPKGVMLSHRNIGTMIRIQDNHFKENVFKYIAADLDPSREFSLTLLPFYHIYGLVITLAELINGTPIVFMRGFDPQLFCATIQKYRIRVLKVVPPILVFLAKHPLVSQYDLSSLEFIFTGAAPAGRDLCVELINKYPNLISVAQGYGMTELSLGCIFPALKDGKHRYESSGKLASNMEMKAVDVETGEEVPRGQPGELHFRGPTVMLGYLGRPEATAETIDENGWLKSGDIGIVDEDGFVRIVDRRKELIKVKGYQVPPAELEDLLLTHPRIRDCAVVGTPDGVGGELPKAFVVRADPELTAGDVCDYVKERAAHYKQLKGGVEFVDEIPKSPSGKILRRFLRDRELDNSNKSKI